MEARCGVTNLASSPRLVLECGKMESLIGFDLDESARALVTLKRFVRERREPNRANVANGWICVVLVRVIMVECTLQLAHCCDCVHSEHLFSFDKRTGLLV